MFGSMVLEVAIGLIFVYLLLSLIVTAVTELISGWRKWRSQNLWLGVRNLLDSGQAEEWAAKLYDHPLIQSLSRDEKGASGTTQPDRKGPSYIPSRTFTIALLETLKGSDPAGQLAIKGLRRVLDTTPDSASVADLKTALRNAVKDLPADGAIGDLKGEALALLDRLPDTIPLAQAKTDARDWLAKLPDRWFQMLIENLPDSKLKRSLTAILDESHRDLEHFKTNIEVWFNNSMERVSGWYKRKTQFVHILLAVAVTLFVNVDSVLIVNALSQSQALRQAVVAQAESYAKKQAESGQPPAPVTIEQGAQENPAPQNLEQPTVADPQSSESTPAPETSDLTASVTTSDLATASPVTSDLATSELSAGDGVPAKTAAASAPSATSGQPTDTDPGETFRRLRSQIDQLNLPVGWVLPRLADAENRDFRKWPGWVWTCGHFSAWLSLWAETIRYHFFGWLLTAFAISLGAPFWFDMLNKVINIRSSGKSPEEKPKPPQTVPQPLEPGQTPPVTT